MKVLIVDDEILARDSLKIQLSQFENIIIFEAANGKLGLEIMESENPDLVFIDIQMPEMTGLEFMEFARKISQQAFFVVLSGFDSFTYAQKSMEYDTFRYLLKPINDTEIKKVVYEVRDQLLIQKTKVEKYKEIYSSEKRKEQSLRRKYIYELLNTKKDRKLTVLKKLDQLGIYFKYPYFQIVLIRTNKLAIGEEEIFKFGVGNIAKEIFENEGEIYLFDDISGVGLLLNMKRKDIEESFEKEVNNYFAMVNKYCDFVILNRITMGVGKRKEGIESLDIVYDSAKHALELYLTGGERQLYSDKKYEQSDENKLDRYSWEKRFTKGLVEEDKQAVIKCIDDFYGGYVSGDCKNIKDLHRLHLSFFVLIIKTMRSYKQEEVVEDEFYWYSKIQKLDSIDEMRSYLMEKIDTCFDLIESKANNSNHKVILMGKQFIEENIGNELTLNATAEYAGVSPAYFSKIFKEEVHENFIDYVTERRMKIACDLLASNMKTAEISEKIGYHDIKHFYKKFKSYIGVTPSQYRKKIR